MSQTLPTIAVTPSARRLQLMSLVREQSFGNPDRLATTLQELATHLDQSGSPDVAAQGRHAAEELRRRALTMPEWRGTSLYHRLTARETLTVTAVSPSPAHRPATVSGRKTIHWSSLEGARFGPPPEPTRHIQTPQDDLHYFAQWLTVMVLRQSEDGAVGSFYKISDDARRRLRAGAFVPPQPGNFPTEDAAKLILTANAVDPRYGVFLQALVRRATFATFGWPLGRPKVDAPWEIHLLHDLREYFFWKLLQVGGRDIVLADPLLRNAVTGETRFHQDARWHSGRLRRDVFEPWLAGIAEREARIQAAQQELPTEFFQNDILVKKKGRIGDGILKEARWFYRAQGGTLSQIKWLTRVWVAFYWYDCLPAEGLLFSSENLGRFVRHEHERGNFAKDQTAILLLGCMADFYLAILQDPDNFYSEFKDHILTAARRYQDDFARAVTTKEEGVRS